jgi:hypothetical protein
VRRVIARLLRVSPALVIAMLALFVALTGTAVATTSALITGKQIKNSSITGLDVKNKSLTPKDFKGSVRGPRGLTGPKGDKGDKGDPGAPNPNAANSELLDGLDSTQFQKVPTAPQHLVYPGSAVIDGDGAGRVQTFVQQTGAAGNQQWCARTGGAGFDFMPVELPQGVVVTSITANYGDDAANSNPNGTAYFTRMSLFGSGGAYRDVFVDSLPNNANAGSLSSATDSTPTSVAEATIDNTKYTYNIILDLGTATAICAVDVTYTVAPGFDAAAVERQTHPSKQSTLP